MTALKRGDVVLVLFQNSDLVTFKRRPALVVQAPVDLALRVTLGLYGQEFGQKIMFIHSFTSMVRSVVR